MSFLRCIVAAVTKLLLLLPLLASAPIQLADADVAAGDEWAHAEARRVPVLCDVGDADHFHALAPSGVDVEASRWQRVTGLPIPLSHLRHTESCDSFTNPQRSFRHRAP